MVVHSFNPSTLRQRQADLSDFETSLVYKVSPRQPGLCYTEGWCVTKGHKRSGHILHHCGEVMAEASNSWFHYTIVKINECVDGCVLACAQLDFCSLGVLATEWYCT